jgi:hypothetical protein
MNLRYQKIALLLIFVLSIFMLKAQHRSAGYLYTYPLGVQHRFEYLVSTSFGEGAYETVYRIYPPGSGKCRYTITASHFKDSKTVVVAVNDEQYILTVMNGKEEASYYQPNLKPFGIRGNVGILGRSAPSQLVIFSRWNTPVFYIQG